MTDSIRITPPKHSNGPPVVVPAFRPHTGAAPLQVQFTSNAADQGDGTLSYLWNFGDSGYSIEANPKHTYTWAGTYLVQLKVSSREWDVFKSLLVTVEPKRSNYY